MTRTQKKCMIFSVGFHGLLLLVLVVGSAFENSPSRSEMQVITMIPGRILDDPGVGGGNPNAQTPPPQPQPPPPPVTQPQQAPTVAAPSQPKPIERSQPRPVEQPDEVRESRAPALLPSPKKHHEIQVDLSPASAAASSRHTKPRETASNSAAQAAEARRLQDAAHSLNGLASSLETKTSTQTSVDSPGQGGGEAFADYRTVVFNVYFHAWITPDSVANRLATAKARVVVARDGSILSAEIIDRSGESGVDKSVERALHSVDHLPPVPAGATDDQRAFILQFNLDAKESSG